MLFRHSSNDHPGTARFFRMTGFFALATWMVCTYPCAQETLRSYVVKYSASPPVIDGVISVSEYALASPAQEAFFLTGSNKKPSPSRYSLMALWDDQCLYVAFWCSDTGIPSQEGFPGDNITQTWPGFIFKGLYEDVTFLFDPGNPADNVHDKEKGDSYQISVQLVNGIRPAGISKPPYLFTEARYNSLFGGATWRPTDIAVGVNLAGGISVEIAIPFSNLNQRYGAFMNAHLGENDLEITGPPKPGDQWAFQVVRIRSSGANSIWNYQPYTAVAMHPYGIFKFARDGAGSSLPAVSSDVPSPFSLTPRPTLPPPATTPSIASSTAPASPFALPPATAPATRPAAVPISTPIPGVSQATPAVSSGKPASPFALPSTPASSVASPPIPGTAGSPPPSGTAVVIPGAATPSPFISGAGQTAVPGSVAPPSSPQTEQPTGTPVTTGNIYSDLDEGKNAIRSQKKPGIVLLVTPQDLETQRVEKILQTPQFQTILKDMILIRVDVTKDPKIMSRYGIHKTPSLMLYDSKGMMRKKISSMTDVNSMMREFQSLK